MNEPTLAFDRGTLLLRGLDDASGLPGVLYDPRVDAHRAPAFRWSAIREALDARGTAFRDEAGPRGPEPEGLRTVELRPYQQAALTAWDLAGRRGVVVLPTGSGKTRVALAAIEHARARTLCLVPTRVLLDQWRREVEVVHGGPAGVLGDGERRLAPITVATFESAWRLMPEIGARFDLIVVDECHHFGAGLRDEALEMSPAPARLGLTATPARERPGLVELIGPVVYELSIGDLAGTFLAGFDLVTLGLDLSAEERLAYDADMKAFRAVHARFRALAAGATWSEFAKAAGSSAEGRAALAAFRRVKRLLAFPAAKGRALASLLERHREQRVLVFTSDNATAYEVARRHLVQPITCDIGRSERDEVLARFRRGELRALVSAQVLNEGFDVPDADVAVVVGGAQGRREHVQRVGRLLRPAPGKRALVYELVARATIEVGQARRRKEGLCGRSTPRVVGA